MLEWSLVSFTSYNRNNDIKIQIYTGNFTTAPIVELRAQLDNGRIRNIEFQYNKHKIACLPSVDALVLVIHPVGAFMA